MANENEDKKNFTYAHSTFFIENGERHGPLATYLVTAAQRPKFALWTNTNARRLIRTGGHITGVELECTKNGSVGAGYSGKINVTPGTGRVIVSAGTFGSAKLLFRSMFAHEFLQTFSNLFRWHWTRRPTEHCKQLCRRWRYDDRLGSVDQTSRWLQPERPRWGTFSPQFSSLEAN